MVRRCVLRGRYRLGGGTWIDDGSYRGVRRATRQAKSTQIARFFQGKPIEWPVIAADSNLVNDAGSEIRFQSFEMISMASTVNFFRLHAAH